MRTASSAINRSRASLTRSADRVVDVTTAVAFLSGTHDGIAAAAGFAALFGPGGSHEGPSGGLGAADAAADAQVSAFDFLIAASSSLATPGIGSIVLTIR